MFFILTFLQKIYFYKEKEPFTFTKREFYLDQIRPFYEMQDYFRINNREFNDDKIYDYIKWGGFPPPGKTKIA